MKKRIIKSILPILLSAALITTPAANADETAAGQNAAAALGDVQGAAVVDKKDEVIYATLQSDGGVLAIYAVNSFQVKEPGLVTDYGNYSCVINLTDTKPLGLEGDTVQIPAQAGQVYYQGNMDTSDLPWTFSIQYILDGNAVAAQDLAGKSGELQIKIKSEQNKTVNSAFYENYMLQISLTLDSEKCADIKAEGAVFANSGKSRMITYTVMPNSDADITIETEAVRLRPEKSEVERLWADNQKAKELLGWTPQFAGKNGFKRGLQKTVDWFIVPENLKKYKVGIYNV
jgi:hypothetical protein